MRPSTRHDWLAAVALLAGLAAAWALPPATTGDSAARAIAALAIGALLALAVARNPFTFAPRIRTAFGLLVAFALWYVASRLWAIDPGESMAEGAQVSAVVLLGWAAHTAVTGVGARRLLLAGIAGCALFVSARPGWEFLQHGAPQTREAGELGYWNASAIVALMLVPVAVAIAGSARRRLILAALVLLPIASVAAVSAASRGALVALVVALLFQAVLDPDYRGGLPRALVAGGCVGLIVAGLAVDEVPAAVAVLVPTVLAGVGFAVIRARRLRRAARAPLQDAAELTPPVQRRRGVQLAGAGIVVLLAVLLVALVVDAGNGRLPDRSANESARLTSTDDGLRTAWWQEGIDIWQSAPLVGVGGGGYALEVGERPAHVHSLPVEVLLETGLVGAALLLAASIQFLRVLRRGERTVERALGGAIAALVLAQALIDWSLSYPQIAALVALAVPLALQSPPDPSVERVPATRALAAVTMLGALAAATLVAFVPAVASLLADQATEDLDHQRPAAAAKLYAQSLQLVPSLDTLTLQVVALDQAGQHAAARQALRDHEQVWSVRRDGLELARDVLGDDRELAPMINRRIEQLDADARIRDLS